MTIEIKNITVGSLFDQVRAGPRWSALKVFYNLNPIKAGRFLGGDQLGGGSCEPPLGI